MTNIVLFLQTKFNIPERGKKAVFSRINDAWRRHKYSIKRDHFLKYSSMKERLKNRPNSISKYHFKKLLMYWKDNHVQVSYLFCIQYSKKNVQLKY